MNAVIMAGGTGTRLRPLTCDIPKPLIPLCGKPVLEYTLDLLSEHFCKKAVMTLMYLGSKIVSHFENKDNHGIEINYSFEETPLGTAGSVKQAACDFTDDFIVISGDALCDFDLTAAMNFHKDNGSFATLIVKSVQDPREYGLVDIAQDGKIKGFLEKPSIAHCITNLANTGIYILSPHVLNYITDGKSVDFAQDVFPKLLEENKPLYAYEDNGYWCDIGDFKTLLSCQKDMLEEKVKCKIPGTKKEGIYWKNEVLNGEFTVSPPAYIGSNVTVGKNAKIEQGTVIGDNCVVSSGAKLRGSIISDGVYMCKNVSCVNAIVGKNSRLLKNSSVFEGAVLGADSILGADSVVSDNVKVWNNKNVPEGIELKENLQYGNAEEVICGESGICGEINVNVTPELCSKIGASMASLIPNAVIGVGYTSSQMSKALAMAIISGILSAGGDAWDFGECFNSQFDFCCAKSMADYGIFISAESNATIKTSVRGGLPLIRPMERKLEGSVNRNEYKKAEPDKFGELSDLTALSQMYAIELIKTADAGLDGVKAIVKTGNSKIRQIMNECLDKMGCEVSQNLCLYISDNGDDLSIYTDMTGYVNNDRLLALACLIQFQKGFDVSVPYSAPRSIDNIAEQYGKKVHRYYDCPCDSSDNEARQMALSQPFLRDALLMSIKILSFMKENKITFAEALSLIPKFATSQRIVKVKSNVVDIMQKINKDEETLNLDGIKEGINISHENGDVLIRPIKTGKGIMLITESVMAETADELGVFFEKMIKSKENNSKKNNS